MPRSNEVEALIAETAATIMDRLTNKLPAMARSLQELLFHELPEVGGDVESLNLLRDAAQGNLEAFFPAVRHGISIDDVQAPTAALEHARRMAQRGVDAYILMRGYRLGHQAVINFVLDEVGDAHLESQLGLRVFEQISASSFHYIDRMSRLVLTAYQTERDRWLANQSRLQVLRVREVLDGGEIDADETSGLISYPLQRLHVALIVWCAEKVDNDELDTMERFVCKLATSIGAEERPLFVAADHRTAWAWIPLAAKTAKDPTSAIRRFVEKSKDAPWITVGDPLPGVAGFRESHRQANTARTVVTASSSAPAAVTAASDPGLIVAAQFSYDMNFARSWVHNVLGPLASVTDTDERMRETLRQFLRTGSGFKATADDLHLHVNTVKYRVQRAIERRGKPINDDRIDVEIALLLCHWFGTAVL
jgi:DNA-binding PucR family transcriptional regulator